MRSRVIAIMALLFTNASAFAPIAKRAFHSTTRLAANPVATCKTSMGTFKVRKARLKGVECGDGDTVTSVIRCWLVLHSTEGCSSLFFIVSHTPHTAVTCPRAYMYTLQVELFLDTMPVTASNFIDLANSGYYDGLSFHRVTPK